MARGWDREELGSPRRRVDRELAQYLGDEYRRASPETDEGFPGGRSRGRIEAVLRGGWSLVRGREPNASLGRGDATSPVPLEERETETGEAGDETGTRRPAAAVPAH